MLLNISFMALPIFTPRCLAWVASTASPPSSSQPTNSWSGWPMSKPLSAIKFAIDSSSLAFRYLISRREHLICQHLNRLHLTRGAHRMMVAATDDDVVMYSDPERVGSVDDLLRHVDVCFRWRRMT